MALITYRHYVKNLYQRYKRWTSLYTRLTTRLEDRGQHGWCLRLNCQYGKAIKMKETRRRVCDGNRVVALGNSEGQNLGSPKGSGECST
ncbi:uncharacterized protein LOC112494683 isoform X2 [Cephus cinctus]|uniref:Uncharacterized protein LOC112494683 isoform X2 n=1 Tax=Cephus cinctus TaxID=211228 RepID=A0AAJ7RML5_CEPCN|nr:uncharacterized protein LOC112494683 isoform X2 [Cephus cinctus]